MYFMKISEQTAIISLYSINWLVFITEVGSVYCAVRTEYLNIIQVILNLASLGPVTEPLDQDFPQSVSVLGQIFCWSPKSKLLCIDLRYLCQK